MKNLHRLAVKRADYKENTTFEIYHRIGLNKHKTKYCPSGWHYRFTQFICAFLIVSILSVSTPAAAPRTIAASLGEFHRAVRFSFLSSNLAANFGGWANNFLLFFAASKSKSQQINKIEILPGDVTVFQGEEVDFSAVAYTNEGDTIGGLKFEWTVEILDKVIRLHPMPNGRFKSKIPGNYIITAETEGFQAQVKVTVKENEALLTMKKLKDEEAKGILTNINKLKNEGKYKDEDISSKKDYKDKKDKDKDSDFLDNIFGWLTGEEKNHGPNANDSEYNNGSSSATALMRPADEDGWGNDNWWLADDPNNQTGNPPGTSPDAGAGNGNFQFSAPVVALSGRGIDINLSLNYNSRMWSKSGTKMTYDADKGSPAPGWSLGFGKLMFMGTGGGCMLADANGTRHGYTGTVSNYNYGSTSSTSFTGYAADGTFIDYSCYYSSNSYGKSLSGTAKLSNGTIINYGSPTITADQAFPTRITDPQGNYITITYRNNRGPEIQTVTDTMGRVITFNYDSLNRLISVDVPKYDNGGTRTAVRLHYKQITLSPGFGTGMTTDTATNTPYVIDAIYYPSTNTGYWFNETDSYSSYGMIAKVIEQRGMSWSGSAGDQGTVTAGTMNKKAVYDYPLTANYTLTDAPTYNNLTESWAGMDTTEAVTNYVINFNASPRTITVTQPNGLKSKQYMYNAVGQWNDGLIYQDETLDASNNILNKSVVSWQQGAYNSPRPTQTEVTDEKNQTLKTVNAYGTSYNQLTSVKEYDYDGTTLIRETKNTYENSTNYTWRHIFNLVKTTEVYDSIGVRVARTDYEFDNAPLADTPNVIMYDRNYDPNTDEWCGECGACLEYYNYGYSSLESDPCLMYEGEWISNADAIYKGNITKVKSYSDAQNLGGAVEEIRKYDITGNMISTSSACCQLTTFTYDSTYKYAYPVSQTRGSSDPNSTVKNTTSAVYDFNTGLTKQTTDANGRTSTTAYNADTLRPTTATSSTGAYSQIIYDDAAMKITEEAHESGGALAGKTIKYLNGIGQVIKEESPGAGGILDIVEAKYTNLGQPWKQTRPYRSGDTLQWTETFYDIQGRTIKIQEPDGSLAQAFHNEITARPSSASTSPGQTVRVVDDWGRERWGRYDAKGKLAEVVEPNPTGNGTVAAAGNMVTTYQYDALNLLTETTQGSQTRKFKYDSLGRLTRQKLAEQSATLNDLGQYVGGTGTWSEAFWYDTRSNLTMKIDARGVKTHLAYQTGGADDPFNRLQSRVYDLSGPLDTSSTIHAAPSVTYEYMTTGDKTRISRIRTAGLLTEDYAYDGESRVTSYTQTVDYRTSYPMTTSYIYDTLNRVKEVHYPAQYGLAGNPRKVVEHNYDTASRLSTLKVGGQLQAGDIIYNAADQTTSIKIGAAGANQVTENYTYDQQTGLLTNQKVQRGGLNLLDLSYEYNRNTSSGTLNGKTGHLTKIVDNLNANKNREYKFDALGRLSEATGGTNGMWTQSYSYDRYGNRTNVTATGVAAGGSPIPLDGTPNLTYEATNNRINTTLGYQYDAAGNQTKAKAPDGSWLKFEYDAANRLQVVKRDSDGVYIQAFQFGSTNARLMDLDYSYGYLKIFASIGGQTLSEYTEFVGSTPTWTKSYNYLGNSVLSTISNVSGSEVTEFNHPDRLGTRVVTNQTDGTNSEQTTLPFGTALNAESTTSLTKRFTSYERSQPTGLDYAVNRTYDSKQGRFTQVDPIGMSASSLLSPQTLNLYTYCGNDPINHVDPDGLFFGSFFKWLGNKLWDFAKKVFYAAVKAAVTALVTFVTSGFNVGAAVGAFIGAFVANLAFPKMGNILTPGWNPDVRHPLSGVSSLNTYIIVNFSQTGLVPLTGAALQTWITARDALISLLKNKKSDCYKFLKKKGYSPEKKMNNLKNQIPYSDQSTIDANMDFGVYGVTVKDFLSGYGSYNAATGNTGRIYYNSSGTGLTTTVILHENLHSTFRGKSKWTIYDPNLKPTRKNPNQIRAIGRLPVNDNEIQNKLGIAIQGDSTNIDTELAKNGCK